MHTQGLRMTSCRFSLGCSINYEVFVIDALWKLQGWKTLNDIAS